MKLWKTIATYTIILDAFCIPIWLQAYVGQGVECGVFYEECSLVVLGIRILMRFRLCSLVEGSMSLEVGFEIWKALPSSNLSSLFSACSSRCEHLSIRFLLPCLPLAALFPCNKHYLSKTVSQNNSFLSFLGHGVLLQQQKSNKHTSSPLKCFSISQTPFTYLSRSFRSATPYLLHKDHVS